MFVILLEHAPSLGPKKKIFPRAARMPNNIRSVRLVTAQVEADKQQDVVTGNIDWKAFNLRMKQKFRVWVKADPGCVLFIMALVLKPLLNLVHRLLCRGSKNWEMNEKAKEARQEQRTYVVLEASRMTDLKLFRKEVDTAFHTEVVGVPRTQHLLHFQVMMFRMLSTAACAVEFYFYTAWRAFPVQVFSALDGGTGLWDAKECLLCPLARLIRQEYPEPKEVPSKELQALLRALAAGFSLDISDLESRHAATRRITAIKSVQAKTPQLATVSADWVCRGNSINRREVLMKEEPLPGQELEANPEEAKPKEHRANPWYAFVSDECKGKIATSNVDMAALGEKFRNLDEASLERYRERAMMSKLAAQRNLPKPPARSANAAPAASFGRGSSSSSLVAADESTLALEIDAGMELLQTEKLDRMQSEKNFKKELERTLKEYKEDETHLQELLSQWPAMLATCFPALVGIHGREVHLPADDFAEAGGKSFSACVLKAFPAFRNRP